MVGAMRPAAPTFPPQAGSQADQGRSALPFQTGSWKKEPSYGYVLDSQRLFVFIMAKNFPGDVDPRDRHHPAETNFRRVLPASQLNRSISRSKGLLVLFQETHRLQGLSENPADRTRCVPEIGTCRSGKVKLEDARRHPSAAVRGECCRGASWPIHACMSDRITISEKVRTRRESHPS